MSDGIIGMNMVSPVPQLAMTMASITWGTSFLAAILVPLQRPGGFELHKRIIGTPTLRVIGDGGTPGGSTEIHSKLLNQVPGQLCVYKSIETEIDET